MTNVLIEYVGERMTDRTPPGGTQINLSYDATGNLTQEGSSDGDYNYTYD